MTAPGTGVMLNWLDLAPGSAAAFTRWHNAEHLPERVSLPGFRRGARYRATSATPATGQSILIVYEADTPETFTSTAYLARLDDPTPQTRAVAPHLRHVTRMVGRVTWPCGAGLGGWLLVARMPDGERGSQTQLCGGPGILSACLGVALPDLAATKTGTREGGLTQPQDSPAGACLLIHLTDPLAMAPLVAAQPGLSAAGATLYRLEAALDRRDCQAPRP
jgi:hypothetical protein